MRIKVKITLVQALGLCTGRTAQLGSWGIAIPFHDHGTRRGWGVSVTSRPLFTPGKDPVPIVQEADWASEPVWTGAENFALIGIRSPDRPARSQSLYRLSYPAYKKKEGAIIEHFIFVTSWEIKLRNFRRVFSHISYSKTDTGLDGKCLSRRPLVDFVWQ